MSGIEDMMTYAPGSSPRVKDVRAYKLLTSKGVVGVFVAGFLIATGAIFIAIPEPLHSLLVLVADSITALAFMAFAYGSSYFPYRVVPLTPTFILQRRQVPNNIIDAADFTLLRCLGESRDTVSIYAALQKSSSIRQLLRRLQLDANTVFTEIEQRVLPSITLTQFAYHATNIAAHTNAAAITCTHAFGVFLLHPNIQAFLRQHGLREQDIHFAIWWQVALERMDQENRRWWSNEKIAHSSGIGLSWAAGFTPLLDRFSYFPVGNVWDTAFGREEEVGELINTLAREQQSNVILVGHPGVGRLGVIKEVARRVARQEAHPALRHQRVVYVHIGQLLALGKSGPEQLQFVARILDEMEKAGNIIAVLDGLGSLLGGMGGESINVTDVLQPFFSSQKVRVVAIMSTEEYHTRLKNNDELLHLFEVVQIGPLLPEAAQELLAVTLPAWEKHQRIFVPYQTLRGIITITAGIMPHIPFPEKAFDVLEEAAVQAQASHKHLITLQDIEALITHKVGVPVGKVLHQESQKLLDLADFIHKRVVNQTHGVQAVSRAMIRARAGVRNESRPIGTFLFLGPTGVGKTETAKALAESYFGDEEYLQRLDMSEFQTGDGVSRLIGEIGHPSGRLTNLIADHPFCVLLLDEFEKAHISVQQLFLQVLDEGRLTDTTGREFSFRHAIIIATSNAGAEFIRTNITGAGTVPEDFEKQLREHLLQQGIFRPELLNRFDGVITFTPLSPDHIRQVARLMLKKLNARFDASQGVTVAITDELVNYLVSIGYNPEFGARPMARAIQNTVEYAVARRALKGQLVPGQQISLTAAELQSTTLPAR